MVSLRLTCECIHPSLPSLQRFEKGPMYSLLNILVSISRRSLCMFQCFLSPFHLPAASPFVFSFSEQVSFGRGEGVYILFAPPTMCRYDWATSSSLALYRRRLSLSHMRIPSSIVLTNSNPAKKALYEPPQCSGHSELTSQSVRCLSPSSVFL